MVLEVKKPKADGRIETFTPHMYKDGRYRVLIPVNTLEEVERYALEGCPVRVKGDISGQLNLSRIGDSN